MSIKRIDHIAIVVPDIEQALGFYRDALGLELTHTERVDDQDVQVAFLPVGDSAIELIEPISEEGSVARHLSKRGPGIHHICLEVDDIEAVLGQLKSRGVRLVNEEPTIGGQGKKIAFIHPQSARGVLIELAENSKQQPLP
jgi:methylmalonyl-CoA/ethylmalonyl-CoA epimerase